MSAVQAAWGVTSLPGRKAVKTSDRDGNVVDLEVDTGSWPKDLKRVLNLINTWIMMYKRMMSRDKLTDAECSTFGNEVAKFCSMWKDCNLSETKCCESSCYDLWSVAAAAGRWLQLTHVDDGPGLTG